MLITYLFGAYGRMELMKMIRYDEDVELGIGE
jgi:hypothetical protein